MENLTLMPRDAARLERLEQLKQMYSPNSMFLADELYYSGTVYRLPDTFPAGNLSGRLFVHFSGADFTLYLKNGYIQPLGSFTGGVFTPSLLGTMYPSEVTLALEYLRTVDRSQLPTSND